MATTSARSPSPMRGEPSWLRKYGIAIVACCLVAAAIIAALVAAPIFRGKEISRLEALVTESSTVAVAELGNPALFDGQSDEARALLDQQAQTLSRNHDSAVLATVRFAHAKSEAAIAYTAYLARIGEKIKQVSDAQIDAAAKDAAYDATVGVLKTALLKDRPAAQDDVARTAGEARAATELAYQQWVLLNTLTKQYPFVRDQALAAFSTLGPDVSSAIDAIKKHAEEATLDAHLLRRKYNIAARISSRG